MFYFSFPVFLFLMFFAGAVLRSKIPAPGGGLLLFENDPDDDSDMKIVGVPKKTEEPDNAAQELERQRLSGNLEKAHALSARLAEKIIDVDGDNSFGSDEIEGSEIRAQRRLLLAFVVDYGITIFIGNSILGTVVINQFYDDLKKSLPEFYEDIRESASFSFYYLCIRGSNSVQSCIGGSFAMLTGHEGSEPIAEFGEALYHHFIDIVEQEIKACNFA